MPGACSLCQSSRVNWNFGARFDHMQTINFSCQVSLQIKWNLSKLCLLYYSEGTLLRKFSVIIDIRTNRLIPCKVIKYWYLNTGICSHKGAFGCCSSNGTPTRNDKPIQTTRHPILDDMPLYVAQPYLGRVRAKRKVFTLYAGYYLHLIH